MSSLAALLFTTPLAVFGGEIHHHSITRVYEDTAVVMDHTPSGDSFYTCSLNGGECTKTGDKADNLYPKINGYVPGIVSRTGQYGARQMTFSLGNYLYYLYDLSNDKPKLLTILNTHNTVKEAKFSPDESVFVLVMTDGSLTFYDLEDRNEWSVSLGQIDLPYLSISPNAKYVSTYNYTEEVHKIQNTKTGKITKVNGAPGIVEFSENNKKAAFIRERNGFRNLYELTIADNEVSSIATGKFLVEDYIYLDNTLYYLSNEKSPLSWNLYNSKSGDIVDENVAYETYLTRYDNVFVYGKLDEKNIDMYIYDGEESTRLSAAKLSKRAPGLTREEIVIANRSAAYVRPEKIRSGDLYIWLHGGPRRQTSVGYHPYLSYAVYDELMENIAAAGNHVIKLDYAGSWGYGTDFIEMLQDNVGKTEIDDLEKVIKEFKKDHRVKNVYLIGNSYGGYMALRGVNALSDELDGVISINGVSNWYTLISEIPSSPFNVLFNGAPNANNLNLYLAASAFTEVKNIDNKTPIMVVYGTEDTTVPPRQSTDYITFMKGKDKNVIDVPLVGAKHTITRRENLTELCTAIKDTFEVDDLSCKK